MQITMYRYLNDSLLGGEMMFSRSYKYAVTGLIHLVYSKVLNVSKKITDSMFIFFFML